MGRKKGLSNLVAKKLVVLGNKLRPSPMKTLSITRGRYFRFCVEVDLNDWSAGRMDKGGTRGASSNFPGLEDMGDGGIEDQTSQSANSKNGSGVGLKVDFPSNMDHEPQVDMHMNI
ncbi:hypothetical protein RJT34_33130 [Clitoria ternatea]|uniref:Uncharacterized protein n=1 Tax=Clitoria ternatea TaxID=43366 RepID=A0AAN9I6J2_CLITE